MTGTRFVAGITMCPHVSGPVHTTPRVSGLPSTRIRHENGAFRKRSRNRTGGICKRGCCVFSVDGKHLKNRAFPQFSTNPKWRVPGLFTNFSGVVWAFDAFTEGKCRFSNSFGNTKYFSRNTSVLDVIKRAKQYWPLSRHCFASFLDRYL